MLDWSYIDKIMQTCSFSQTEKQYIISRLSVLQYSDDEFSREEVYQIIARIKDNQYDLIAMGFNYNMTDIKYKLRKTRPLYELE